jgi:hypothetical protein
VPGQKKAPPDEDSRTGTPSGTPTRPELRPSPGGKSVCRLSALHPMSGTDDHANRYSDRGPWRVGVISGKLAGAVRLTSTAPGISLQAHAWDRARASDCPSGDPEGPPASLSGPATASPASSISCQFWCLRRLGRCLVPGDRFGRVWRRFGWGSPSPQWLPDDARSSRYTVGDGEPCPTG